MHNGEATHTCAMPSMFEQPDGTHVEEMPFCEECAVRIDSKGFRKTSLEEYTIG